MNGTKQPGFVSAFIALWSLFFSPESPVIDSDH